MPSLMMMMMMMMMIKQKTDADDTMNTISFHQEPATVSPARLVIDT